MSQNLNNLVGPIKEGFDAVTICDNPYWREFPKPSKLGFQDELNARGFVDGYCLKIKAQNEEKIMQH